jgi:hypothetical protein
MKPISKTCKKLERRNKDFIDMTYKKSEFKLTPVSKKEREIYRVPVYDYILP